MSNVITMLNLINDAVFVSLVNTTLQMTLLISLIALVIWMFRIKSATTRYSLWLFALFAAIALPLITPFIPQIDFAHSQRTMRDRPDGLTRLRMEHSDVCELSEGGHPLPSAGAAKTAVNREMDVSLINPVSIAYFIWCAGAFFMLCMTLSAYRKLRKLRVSSPDVKNSAALEILSRQKQTLGVRRPVALKVSSEIYTPVSVGVLSPAIIIPDGVIPVSANDNHPHPSLPPSRGKGYGISPASSLPASSPPLKKAFAESPPLEKGVGGISELEMILTHELAHIKRSDYLTNFLQNMLRAIFFFHPLFHLMNRNLAREREHICDDWVIHVTKQRSGYAECIVSLLEKALCRPANVPVSIAMAERKRDIPGRIDMIVDAKRKIVTKASRRALVAMLIIGCLSLPVIGGIGLVRFAGARPASDEGRIVFGRYENETRTNSIWTMDADGKNEKQLASGGYPAWSPDRKQIVFSRWAALGENDPNSGIFIMNADGSNVKQLTNSPDDYWPNWSPDGRQIAFTRLIWEQKDGEWDIVSSAIHAMDSDGTNLRKLAEQKSPNYHGRSDWSPDGTEIVFVIDVVNACQIWVMDADGGNPKMIQNGGYDAAWSPDGKRIAFTSRRDGWRFNNSACDIYVMDADGANVKILTVPDPSAERHPAWSPDGTKIAFSSSRDGTFEICVMDADGSNVQRLTNTGAYNYWPDWGAFSYAVESAGKLRSTWGKIKRGLFGK